MDDRARSGAAVDDRGRRRARWAARHRPAAPTHGPCGRGVPPPRPPHRAGGCRRASLGGDPRPVPRPSRHLCAAPGSRFAAPAPRPGRRAGRRGLRRGSAALAPHRGRRPRRRSSRTHREGPPHGDRRRGRRRSPADLHRSRGLSCRGARAGAEQPPRTPSEPGAIQEPAERGRIDARRGRERPGRRPDARSALCQLDGQAPGSRHARAQRRDDRTRARPPPRHPRRVVAGPGTRRQGGGRDGERCLPRRGGGRPRSLPRRPREPGGRAAGDDADQRPARRRRARRQPVHPGPLLGAGRHRRSGGEDGSARRDHPELASRAGHRAHGRPRGCAEPPARRGDDIDLRVDAEGRRLRRHERAGLAGAPVARRCRGREALRLRTDLGRGGELRPRVAPRRVLCRGQRRHRCHPRSRGAPHLLAAGLRRGDGGRPAT